jgi:hypothetical protein
MACWSKISPLLVALPWNPGPYQEAMPDWSLPERRDVELDEHEARTSDAVSRMSRALRVRRSAHTLHLASGAPLPLRVDPVGR